MELENIVANTVLLKAREGKTLSLINRIFPFSNQDNLVVIFSMNVKLEALIRIRLHRGLLPVVMQSLNFRKWYLETETG